MLLERVSIDPAKHKPYYKQSSRVWWRKPPREARGKLIMPGFVNAHYHSYDVLAKGLLEDMPFDVWALHSQPAYFGRRSKAELRVRTLLGALECLCRPQ
jgi:cytosine/adenosine deaminase-related metal-dependent hydrolase